MDESYAESVATFRSTPDSSADDQDNSNDSLHGVDIEEQSVLTIDVESAAIQLAGGLPPRPDNSSSSSSSDSPKSAGRRNKRSSSSGGGGRSSPPKMTSPEQRTLSKVSRSYDRGDKGYLDDYERKMRSLDKSNRGHLSNDTVYDILRESVDVQKKMVTQRWLIIGLTAFAVLLALANVGTSFAAATLAKDTEVTPTGELANKNNHERVATTAKGYSFTLGNTVSNKDESGQEEETDGSGGGRRRLGLPSIGGGLSGMLNYHITTYNTMPKSDAIFMHKILTTPLGTPAVLGSPTMVRLNWACGKDGIGAQMSGIVTGVETIPYTNAAGTGLDGTLYTYDVSVHGQTQMVAIDCVDADGVDVCVVDGTNCCMTDDDCGEGTTCMSCGCQCQVDNGIGNRCDSQCDVGYGSGNPPIIFRG